MSKPGYFSSETKQELLILMKRRGAVSLDDAEAATGLARTTLREHLGRLERLGLVSRTIHRHRRGRPSHRYELTSEGHALFPSRDGVMLRRLLNHLESEGRDDLIRSFFENFWRERQEEFEYRLGTGGSHGDMKRRLTVLEDMLREQGFMPAIDVVDGQLTIRECNCPFPEAVRHSRLPCRLEARFFSNIFRREVGRVEYIPDGSPACTYRFPAKAPDS